MQICIRISSKLTLIGIIRVDGMLSFQSSVHAQPASAIINDSLTSAFQFLSICDPNMSSNLISFFKSGFSVVEHNFKNVCWSHRESKLLIMTINNTWLSGVSPKMWKIQRKSNIFKEKSEHEASPARRAAADARTAA